LMKQGASPPAVGRLRPAGLITCKHDPASGRFIPGCARPQLRYSQMQSPGQSATFRRRCLGQAERCLSTAHGDPERPEEVARRQEMSLNGELRCQVVAAGEVRLQVVGHYEFLAAHFPDDGRKRLLLVASCLELVRLLWELGRQDEAAGPYCKA